MDQLNLESVINFLYIPLFNSEKWKEPLCVKSGDQSIGWSIEIDFEYLDTEYTMGLRTVERFGFSKDGPHP